MDDLNSSEQLAFSEDEVTKIISETLGTYLNQQTYDEKKVPQWTNDILESINERLIALKKPFKYASKSNYYLACLKPV